METTVPESMEAVHLDAYGGPLTIRRSPVPRPGRGEVLVRMAASPINPSDLAFLQGTYAYRKPLPAIPGLEGSGSVVAAGPGLFPRLLLGRRLACAAAPTSGGTWAEYMVTAAKFCIPLQRGVTVEQGAMLLVNPLTALAFFELAAREKHPAIVSTAAASALGRMILRLGQQQRKPVICIVRRKEQADLLRSLGAEHVLDSSHPDFVPRLQALTHRLRATLLLDAVAGSLTNQLVEAAPFGSTILVYGDPSGEPCVIDVRRLLYEDKKVAGFYLPNWVATKNLLQSLRLSRKAQRLLGTHLQTAVRRRLPLSSVQQGVELYQQERSAGKVLLVADPEQLPLER